ncbi:MAG: chemotaxis protein CheW [Planctomycetes bacterium]|nr:chemotaxis protein CheW [Planctomycetota bacterium]
MTRQSQYCTFQLGPLFLGVEVAKVQEVIRHQQITRVPLAPPEMRGLVNLRGQIVMAIDLRRRFEMPDRAATQLPTNVVLRTDDGAVSLLVDEIGDVLTVAEDLFEPSPETLRGIARELVRGVYKLRSQLLLILDTEKVMQIPAQATVRTH